MLEDRMKFKLEINLDNAAYEDLGGEIRDNLEQVLQRIAQGIIEGRIRDTNGNAVGDWEITE